MKVACNLMTPCHGAVLLCLADTLCSAGKTREGGGGRLAGSDFTLGPNRIGDLPVAVTTFGEQLASLRTGYRSEVLLDLLNYGIVAVAPTPGHGARDFSGVKLDLTTSDVGFTPPGGATASCGGALFVGPTTSCAFARSVQDAFMRTASNDVNVTVTVTSPVTRQSYAMQCVGDAPHVCTGGNNARVVWF